ncbi:MAG: outer membrane beta-barrel domain-containing protein [Myxococcota bacterium]
MTKKQSARGRWMSVAMACAFAAGLSWSPGQAWAQEEEEDVEPAYSELVVQNRKYDPTHEFTVSVGTLPLDAFKKGFTVSGAYTLHFSDKFAWEIVQGSYSFPFDAALNAELDAFNLSPSPFEVVEYFVTSNAIFKPVYWKGSVLNDRLLYGELYLSAGGGYAWLTRSERPVVDLGGGLRLFTSESLSFRVSTRYMLLPALDLDNFDIRQELWIGLGTSLTF